MKATQGTAVDLGRTTPNGAVPSGNGEPSGVEPPVLGGPEHSDYYLLDNLLTDEQRALRKKVREFMDREVIPVINPYWERAEFPFELVPKLAQLDIAGFQISGYGSPGMSNVTAGLVILELARG
ncbi:acyl-CoA dehydrogenase family protein, partial [Streptomyces sp. NPDC058272]